jgi:nitrite reductase/ring-hydroxylating ferredoxin subunit
MTDETWNPVALGRDIPSGTSAGVILDGREIALWRDLQGTIHAWEDRCPHRGMKLSFGFVRGDHIACLYHGWEYGADGRCRRIPAHPELDVPATIRVPTYAVTEASGVIWVAPSGPGQQDKPADMPVTPLRSLFVDTAAGDIAKLLGQGDNPFGGASSGGAAWFRLQLDIADIGIGLHGIGPDRCAIHIVLAGAADHASLDAVALRVEAFRRVAEGVNA